MEKSIKFCIVITMVFIILGMQMSNVIAVSNNDFFYTNKQEISIGETLEITLDISKIKYDEFEFKLVSNLDTNNIVINEDVQLENYNNDLSININKSKTKLDKITFYYQVPDKSQIGTKIELIAQIIAGVEKESEQIASDINEVNIDNNTTGNNITSTEMEYKVVESKKIEVKIVESKQIENQEQPKEPMNDDKVKALAEDEKTNAFEKNDKPDANTSNIGIKKTSESFGTDISVNTNKTMPSGKLQNTSSLGSSISFENASSQVETAIYNGSSNNYLANLEIDGESLNTIFNKENTTYFVKTTGKTELNVKATAEEDEAIINITGTQNLKTGDNKILISVTAENGDVRYYRVFVTNN